MFGNGVGVVTVDLKDIMHNDIYEAIVSKSIEVTSQQVGIPLFGVHPLIFNEMYNPVEAEDSIALPIHVFLLRDGVKLIQKTKETEAHGKYLLIAQSDVKEKVREMIHLMCEKLKNMRTQAAEISNLEFRHYPFIKDRMTIESSKYERAQEYLLDQHYNNYKHKPLQPNANPVQIHQRARPPAVIETKTPSKSYREAVCGNNGEDTMSISSKHNPISTTSLITGGSPNSNKSELKELKSEVSRLYTQMSGFQLLMTNMLAALKEKEEVDRQD